MKYVKIIAAVLLLLIVFFIAKGLLTPSINYETSVTVNAPSEKVWSVLSDESKLPEWIKGFKRTELIEGTANTVGAVSNVYVEENGTEMVMQETITAIEPNAHMAMTFTMDFMDMDYELFLKEEAGKTVVTTNSTTSGNGMLAKSMVSFMKSSMKAQEDENLNNLKDLIERN